MQKAQNNKFVELYPLTKFVWAVAVAVIGGLIPSIVGKYIWFVGLGILAVLSGAFGVFIKRIRNFLCPIVLLLIVIHTFFVPGENVLFQFWILKAHRDRLFYALSLGGNIFCMAGAVIWFFSITSERDFVLCLEKAGMSSQVSYVVLSTLQMVSVLKKRSQTIMSAQQSRGMEVNGNLSVRIKAFIPVIVPLILSSIQDIEERALTLEARGFSSDIPATHLYDIEMKTVDKIAAIAAIVVLVVVIAGRIALCIV